MNYEAIRDAIKARLDDITDIGKIEPSERYAKSHRDLKVFYAVGDLIKGGFIRRTGFISKSPDDYTYIEKSSWEIHYMHSWVDPDSGDAFELMLDLIAREFEQDVTLGGVVQTTKEGDQAAIQLLNSGPAMFAGILVHNATMSLKTLDIYCAP